MKRCELTGSIIITPTDLILSWALKGFGADDMGFS